MQDAIRATIKLLALMIVMPDVTWSPYSIYGRLMELIKQRCENDSTNDALGKNGGISAIAVRRFCSSY
jgi:hypothetical protein